MTPAPDARPCSGPSRRFEALLALALVLVALAALAVGPAGFSWQAVFDGDASDTGTARLVLREVRLPRMLLAICAGASLSLAGAVLQALFRNPLADATLTGISAGAALGAGAWLVLAPLALTTAVTVFALPLAAGLGALLSVLLVLRLSLRFGRTDLPSLLLAGLAINALAGAGLAFMQAVASDRNLRDLTTWLYGNLGRAGWPELAVALPLLVGASALLLRSARMLDVLLLGEATARNAGLDVEAQKRRLMFAVVVIAAVTVALAGMIGFIGLVVPHILRKWLKSPAHARLLPATALAGATLLCAADTLARTVFSPLEIPVGVITALLGVPVFMALIARSRAGGLP